jgi:hypothetical protein
MQYQFPRTCHLVYLILHTNHTIFYSTISIISFLLTFFFSPVYFIPTRLPFLSTPSSPLLSYDRGSFPGWRRGVAPRHKIMSPFSPDTSPWLRVGGGVSRRRGRTILEPELVEADFKVYGND